ncbi:UDP-N-acetylmuramoyl-L-alanyl-D-glutamate--2,6-diaminopimelate ligase [Glaciimonas immobilis]|uniref:UDP-N-acetylmuramoyl-L-alanyl-D-glutamate--2,6-diaminopimelate ligase n=1 Tax=Glaciimonas immobilis TaxID=728004 RepID=A0A840RT32_9BURK|nr:UDP-N-acetylmuramoyl-L-alanyl-D-glutamate--2,6-diaminopimelate ligase [Glaciimonas immobilis]KAF3999668.1 UDP-N-acetylmuramoyl-L-alanyl-D-glutamate--2,6-diaminopimelate ligase [Glaciimonas immobilis]MBB5200106.1 UDP-N-acetylmuramoyl-L-alanyl-D-glutamate--2,6-diaminopimelate ligase [Glaciimonas immobilis]
MTIARAHAASDVLSEAASDVTSVVAWLRGLATVSPTGRPVSDSRKISAGDVFFAYAGDESDGRNYIAPALQNGAAAVVFEATVSTPPQPAQPFLWNSEWAVPHLAVVGLKKLAGPIANSFYQQPDRDMRIIAVTGTNGKTSCSQWLGHALSQLGQTVGVIGTLGIGIFAPRQPVAFEVTGYTTPDAVLLQGKLADLQKAGVQALAIEASSIGLDQGRLNGMHIDIALFTNFTRDHLDYHGDMATYEAAKRALFDWPGLQHAVINLDDAMGLRLVQHLRQNGSEAGNEAGNETALIGYALTDEAMKSAAAFGDLPILRATAVRSNAGGTIFNVTSPFGSSQVKTHLVGQFNVSNVLGILGVLLAKGTKWEVAINTLERLTSVPGRMEQFGGQDAPLIVIDYAHTPDALEKTLLSLRQVAQQRGGELWCVFGCGGDRDPGKRPQMGAIAESADHVIVTSDNPRSEDPTAIIAQIVGGMTAPTAAQTQQDRAAAILRAVRKAGKADVVLLAGKGHETYQEIKGKKLPFLDADHAALALASRATMKGGSV